ncbi:hypothetical protein, partial [uncultured Methanobrevibacter sp.]|uniref:hypothetical protein n=1 Tax=uncultured Methanobrevibacter sp. TaxID=253161 RepID=UPI0025DEDA5F
NFNLMKLNMGDIMDYELNLRKADVIGLYIHYVLLVIGILITGYIIYSNIIRGYYIVALPYIMSMFAFLAIIIYSTTNYEKATTFYKIGVILFIGNILFALPPQYIAHGLLVVSLSIMEIILLIYFILHLDDSKHAQTAINLVVIIGIANLAIMTINTGNLGGNLGTKLLYTFPGLIIQGTLALSYYLATKKIK